MNKPPKTVFQDALLEHKRKIDTLKTRIAAGEYRIDPHTIAEKLLASGFFRKYTSNFPRGLRL